MPKLRSCNCAFIVALLLLAADFACAKPIVIVDKTVSGAADMLGAPDPENAFDGYEHEALMATMVCSILYGAKHFVRAALARAGAVRASPASKRRVML
jgi:hypothetical protein